MADLRVLIVDDEPPALKRIRTLLRGQPDVEVVGECANGHEAVQAIQRLAPDLVFLDVQMPGLDGFEVLDRAAGKDMPAIIIVTAYERHAIRAFEIRALDYLLKPFDAARFEQALDRARRDVARRRATSSPPDEQILQVLRRLAVQPMATDRLAIKVEGRILLVPLDRITWIEAVGKLVRVHASDGVNYLLREPLQSLENRLNPGQFLRIHRSALVNIRSIVDLEPVFHGDYCVRLLDGTELPLGRRYRDGVRRRLGISE